VYGKPLRWGRDHEKYPPHQTRNPKLRIWSRVIGNLDSATIVFDNNHRRQVCVLAAAIECRHEFRCANTMRGGYFLTAVQNSSSRVMLVFRPSTRIGLREFEMVAQI
jgi:hypothetical protein